MENVAIDSIIMWIVSMAPEGWLKIQFKTPTSMINIYETLLRHLLLLTDVIDIILKQSADVEESGIIKYMIIGHRHILHHEILAFKSFIIYPLNDHLLSFSGNDVGSVAKV